MLTSDVKRHWEKIYSTKTPQQLSWYSPRLNTSLSLIERAAAGRSAAIIDVGAGASTLVDDLLERGFQSVTVLDVSEIAIEVTRKRLKELAEQIHWMIADVTSANFTAGTFNIWHDRAVFHFLTTAEQRRSYVRAVGHAVRHGGHVIVGTFGPEGPTKCSGLDVMRYDAESLHDEFGVNFRLVESIKESHQTPFGTTQQFLYCYCRIE